MTRRTVPFFSLEQQTDNLHVLASKKLSDLLKTQQFIGGPIVEEFEQKLASYLNIPHAISCNSGTDALWIALKALEIEQHSIVLTTPFSFIASSSEIVAHGAHPVFIDINPSTFNIDPYKLRLWLEHNAIVKDSRPVHKETGLPVAGILTVDLFGQCANYTLIQEIADEWGLWIIEDMAQAIGAELNGKKAGTFGSIATLSFYPTKNLGAFGDGGACVTNDPHLAQRITRLKNHGRKTHYDYEELGINSRLDAMQAAMLSLKLNELNSYNEKRQALASFYDTYLKEFTYFTTPQAIVGKHVYHQYSLMFHEACERDAFKNHLQQHGIGSAIYYPKSLTSIDFLNTNAALYNPCPIAEQVSTNILSLPIWPELSLQDAEYICDTIKKFKPTVTPQQEISLSTPL